jgi:hypothetical protein
MEGNNMPFKRLVTAYLIDDLMNYQLHVFNKMKHIETVSLTLYNKLKELSNYKREHFNNASDSIYSAMLEVAHKHNLFDPSIYTTYLEIKELLDKLTFINIVLKQSEVNSSYRSANFTSEETHEILVDMFKYHKQRVNLDNYKISLNPDPVVIDTIVEEEDEDLEEQEELIEEEELVEQLVEEFV